MNPEKDRRERIEQLRQAYWTEWTKMDQGFSSWETDHWTLRRPVPDGKVIRIDDYQLHRSLEGALWWEAINRWLMNPRSKFVRGLVEEASALARWALKYDPSPDICAAYAIEDVAMVRFASFRSALTEDVVHYWVDGCAGKVGLRMTNECSSWNYECGSARTRLPFRPYARRKLTGADPTLDLALSCGCLEDDGIEEVFGQTAYADALHPPVKALQFTAEVLSSRSKRLKLVAAYNLGRIGGKVLSTLLSDTPIQNWSSPYWGDVMPGPADRTADVVVFNGVNLVNLAFAFVMGSCPPGKDFEDLQGDITRDDIDSFHGWVPDHDDEVRINQAQLEAACDALNIDGWLVLLGDVTRGLHHDLNEAVRRRGDFAPMPLKGVDTVARPIHIYYGRNRGDWTPFGIPATTGRLFSLWVKTGRGNP